MELKLKVLIAPLDWGLGHTTRCIPVIDYLIQSGCEVVVAAEGVSTKLLRDNFPDLKILPLKGYRIQYSKHKYAFSFKILSQVPKLLKAIKQENQWLKKQINTHHFDLIISDNRYGFYHKEIPSVMMTHQLQILTGCGRILNYILRKVNYRLLNNFKECWVVDEKVNGLSGILAHPSHLPKKAKYIGLLSQLGMSAPPKKNQEKRKKILILLSGPEPMRTILEDKLWKELPVMDDYEITFVAGNPFGKKKEHRFKHVIYHTHLTGSNLSNAFHDSDLIVSRSGYSTLMDIVILNKKALLIPTPGQTEQEYLAKYLKSKSIFFACAQHDISLREDIEKAFSYDGFPIKTLIHKDMEKAITSILKVVKSKF